MSRNNKRIDFGKYKGALIEYMCENCNTNDSFFEYFANKTTRIKSGECSHFNFKSIINFEGNKFKYILSFNCKNCEENEIIHLFDENITTDVSYINYKCKKCGQGSINFQLILSEENLIEDNEENNDLSNQRILERNIYKNNNPNQINNIFKSNQFNNYEINNHNRMIDNNMAYNNINSCNSIKLNFKNTIGLSYDVYASPDQILGTVIRIFLNNHKEIDKKRIGGFISNGGRLSLEKTIKENKLENNSTIIFSLI